MTLKGKFQPKAKHLKAEHLEQVARATDRVERLESPLGGPAGPPPGAAIQILPVFVVARTVNDPAALINHGYTIKVAGETHEISWDQLIVDVPMIRTDPGSGEQQLSFAPAAVVGDAEHAVNPWRAQGLLYRMPDLVNGSPTAMVELFGLSVNLGC